MRISAFFLLVLVGCAKPTYVKSGDLGGIKPGEKTTLTCQARFASQNCVSIFWEKMPTEDEVGEFVFKVFRANRYDGTPVLEDRGDMAVVLWMPGMGHDSTPVKVKQLDVGTYHASEVYFTMRGEWDIQIQVKKQNEVQDQAVVPITF